MKYQNGEYCKDIACKMIGEKSFCHESCEAYQFHDWLNKHGYEIVKTEYLKEADREKEQ